MKKWLKKGDKVVVIAGNDKGKVGEIIAKQDDRILIQGVNIRKRHMKSRDRNTPSEIVSLERPIHISNVAYASAEGKPVKLKVKTEGKEKSLFYLDNAKEVEVRKVR